MDSIESGSAFSSNLSSLLVIVVSCLSNHFFWRSNASFSSIGVNDIGIESQPAPSPRKKPRPTPRPACLHPQGPKPLPIGPFPNGPVRSIPGILELLLIRKRLSTVLTIASSASKNIADRNIPNSAAPTRSRIRCRIHRLVVSHSVRLAIAHPTTGAGSLP